MSNTIMLASTKFSLPDYGEFYGYTICDDYSKDYWDLATSYISDHMELLELAKQNSPEFFNDWTQGIEINKVWYPAEDVFKEK